MIKLTRYLAVVCVTFAAFSSSAATIEFSFLGGKADLWEWFNVRGIPGGPPANQELAGTASFVQLSRDHQGPPIVVVGGVDQGSISFRTGPIVGGTGTLAAPFVWNVPAGGPQGVVGVTGCLPPTKPNDCDFGARGKELFLGTASDKQSAIKITGNGLSFTMLAVQGRVSQSVLDALKFPAGTSRDVTGYLIAGLDGTSPPSPGKFGRVSAGALVLTAVPEASTAATMAAGILLLGLVALKRLRRLA